MLNMNVMNRGTGKTTNVINEMDKDQTLFLIIPYEAMGKCYPKHLRKRVLTVDQFFKGGLRGTSASKVILDEGLLYSKAKVAELYYQLGQYGLIVTSYGTE